MAPTGVGGSDRGFLLSPAWTSPRNSRIADGGGRTYAGGMRDLLTIAMLGPFVPRWCAVRMQAAGRKTIWCAHILGLVLGTALLTMGWWWAYFLEQPAAGIATWGPALPRSPWPSTVDLTIFAAAALLLGVIMTGVATLIVLPMAWRDETMRDTWRHALRTVRLFAPAWMPLAALFGAALMLFFVLVDSSDHPDVRLYLLMACWTVLPLWCLFIVSAAAGAERRYEPVAHEPLCETCGYLLHHVPETLRCPECGDDLRTALDREHRCMPAAGNRIHAARDATFYVPALSAWMQPGRFFGRMRLDQPAWPLIVRGLVAHGVAGLLGWLVFVLVFSAMSDFDSAGIAEMATVFAFMVSALMVGLFGIWCIGVGLVGTIAGGLYGRNLLRAALIVAAYTSAFHVIWSIACVLTLTVVAFLGNSRLIVNPYLPVVLWLTLNTGMAMFYIFGVWRRMRYVRFGNWRFTTCEPSSSGGEMGAHAYDLVGGAHHNAP